jgi:hypothetical protein
MAWSIFSQGGGDAYAVGWANQLLTLLGAPVTPGNSTFVYQWEKAEGGGGAYNPLNTGSVYGHPELTTTGSQYGGGANDFASWSAGLTGTADNLNTPGPDNYPAIVAALKANDPAGARQALFNSGWAASHYGYGANWPNVGLPGATPVDFTTAPLSTTVTPGATTGTSNTCLIGFSSPNVNPIHIWPFNGSTSGSYCVISKSQARAVVGTFLLGAGLGVMVIGMLALAKGAGAARAGAVIAGTPVLGRAAGRFR